MDTQSLASQIEALLFSEGGPLSKKKLAQMTGADIGAVSDAIKELAIRKESTGVVVIETETEAALVVSSESKNVVEAAFGMDATREIGDAGLEVLSVVLYRGPSTRAQIDYIRGVNTSSTIRNLAARGLIERAPNPNDAREYLYRPTAELFAYLGVSKAEELPDYAKIASELAAFEESQKAKEPFEDHATDTTTDAA